MFFQIIYNKTYKSAVKCIKKYLNGCQPRLGNGTNI